MTDSSIKNCFYIYLLIGLGFLLPGCGANTTISDFSSYQDVNLSKANNMPTEEQMKNSSVDVVVLEVDNSGFHDAERANITPIINQELRKYIGEADANVIADRNVPESLKEEVQLAQQRGEGRYTGKTVADYALKGSMNQVNFSSSFEEEEEWEDDDGETHYIPPKCNYTAQVEAIVEVFQIPELNAVETFELASSFSTEEELDRHGDPDDCSGFSSSLYQSAAQEAVHSHRFLVKNFFAPRGYVIKGKRRVEDGMLGKEKDLIYQVSIGRDRGASKGEKVKIIKVLKSKNPLTDESTIERRTVASGVFTDQINRDVSWIRLTNPEKADQIRLGHQAQLIYEPDSLF